MLCYCFKMFQTCWNWFAKSLTCSLWHYLEASALKTRSGWPTHMIKLSTWLGDHGISELETLFPKRLIVSWVCQNCWKLMKFIEDPWRFMMWNRSPRRCQVAARPACLATVGGDAMLHIQALVTVTSSGGRTWWSSQVTMENHHF